MKKAILFLLVLTGCTSKHFFVGTTLDEKISGNHLTFNVVNSDTGNELSGTQNELIAEEIKEALQRKGLVYSPAGSDLVVFYKYFEAKTKVIARENLYLPSERVSNISIRKTMPRSMVMQISDTDKNRIVWGAYATDLPRNLNDRQFRSVVNSLVGKLKYDVHTFAFH